MFERYVPEEIESIIYKKLHTMYMYDIIKEFKDRVVMWYFNGNRKFYIYGPKKYFLKPTTKKCFIL